ncbi:hypothetical protein IWQ49_006412 [Labrenzia sp. EL_126]|nr:hypothetical protein [Labrenzia sp. EL_126]
MTNRDLTKCLYTIVAEGRDSDGTYFQFIDGAWGWNAAAQATSEMFRRVPGEAEINIYEGDPVSGSFRDVTVDLLADAETAFHKASEHWTDKSKVRRTISTYAGAA